MADDRKEHVGSGLDKPDPKGLAERVGDKLKQVLAPKPALPAAKENLGPEAHDAAEERMGKPTAK